METILTLHRWTVAFSCVAFFMPFISNRGVNAINWNPIACKLYECCDKPYVGLDIKKLKKQLFDEVFGQHLVFDVIKAHLQAHFDEDYMPPKPLVLSFHGDTGTGKNHVARIIVNSIFTKGIESKFVHYYHVSKKFPHARKMEEYSLNLQQEIENGVYACSRALFIFDEFDHMPEGLIDRIKFYLDFHENVNGIDYRRSMFIFLTNSGTEVINENVMMHHMRGRKREDICLWELESQVSKKAMSTKGGFYASKLIDRQLVTAYVPFLPLLKQHVIKCIEKELHRRHDAVTDTLIQDVLKQLEFVDELSVSGCKRVTEKVAYALIKLRHREL